MRTDALNLNSQALRDFCRRWRVRELAVFGSFARGDFGPDSDIDFLVDYQDDEPGDLLDAVEMHEELARIVGRRVDLVSRWAVEHDSNEIIRQAILSSVETVYAAR